MKRLLCLLALCATCQVLLGQSATPFVNQEVQQTVESGYIPGLVAAVITPDSVYYGAAGNTRVTGGQPIQLNSKFHLGSNTKAITAFMAMQLVQAQKIGLDQRFSSLYPELPMGQDYAEVDLAALLRHQAGVPAFTAGGEFEAMGSLPGSNTHERRLAFAKHVFNMAPVAPGTYSNAGYALAALMLAKAANTTYEALLDQTMQSLALDYALGFPNKQDSTNYPWGHIDEGNGLEALGPDHDYKLEDFVAPAGDVSINIMDYARFVQLNLQGLCGQDNMLPAAAFKQMHFGTQDYAFGWGNTVLGGMQVSYHDGSAGTYYCHTILLPAKRIAVVVMGNAATEPAINNMYALRETLLAHYMK